MADSSIDLTAASGNVDVRSESSNGDLRQVVVLGDPSTNAGVAPVDGTLGLATFFKTQPTISVVGNFLQGGGTLTAYQGGNAWLTTLATLPVVTNVTGYALESGGNLDSIITTLNNIKTKTDNLDVTLGSRLASGGTLPITGTINALNAGGSVTAFQGGNPWQVTFATIPVVIGTPPVSQSGTWTVQPGNTPNTTAWLVTMGTLPITGSLNVAGQATVTAIQGDAGTSAWLATLATLPVVTNVTGYALEAGNLATIVTTLNSIKSKTDNLDVTLGSRLGSGATLPITGTINALSAGGSLTAFQGGNPWLVTQATLPVVANINNSSLPVTQSGTWTIQPGNTPNTTAWLVTMATIPVVANVNVAGQLTVTAIQGDSGSKAWLTTLATLPVVTNVTGYALESGGNLASIVTTLNSIKTKTDNLDVTLGSRLASGATLPITGTINTLNAGGSLSAFQGGAWTVQPGNTPNTVAWLVTFATIPVVTSVTVGSVNQGNSGSQAWLTTLATLPVVASGTVSALAAGGSLSAAQLGAWSVGQSGTWTVQPGNTPNTVGWLTTQATLPVVANINNATLAVTESGTWTVQPGNTPNTTAWLITQATLPVSVGTPAVTQSGIWNVFSSLASGTSMVAVGQYLPTLASISTLGYNPIHLDIFGNQMVNTNVPLPNSTRFSRFLTFASYASIMAAPGAGRRLVIREMDFSGNATLTVELYEDHAGTPARIWGPHYFLPYSGFIKPTCYIPITANKSLGINITGSAFNSTLDIRIETENV